MVCQTSRKALLPDNLNKTVNLSEHAVLTDGALTQSADNLWRVVAGNHTEYNKVLIL